MSFLKSFIETHGYLTDKVKTITLEILPQKIDESFNNLIGKLHNSKKVELS